MIKDHRTVPLLIVAPDHALLIGEVGEDDQAGLKVAEVASHRPCTEGERRRCPISWIDTTHINM